MGRPRKTEAQLRATGNLRRRGSPPDPYYAIAYGLRMALKHGPKTIRAVAAAINVLERRLYSFVAGEAELPLHQMEWIARELDLVLVPIDWLKAEHVEADDSGGAEAPPEGSLPVVDPT